MRSTSKAGLLAEFNRAVTSIRMARMRTSVNLQPTFDWIRKSHRVKSVVPCSFNLLREQGTRTDLEPKGRYQDLVTRVSIRDALDWKELCALTTKYGKVVGAAAREVVLDHLQRYLQSRIGVSAITPWFQRVGELSYAVFNDRVQLREHWDAGSLSELRHTLESSGLFNLSVVSDDYGTPETSDSETNPDMIRTWTLDCMMSGNIQRLRSPELWRRNLVTNSGFHIHPANVAAAFKTVKDPDWYRKGPASHGMAHIFLPRRKNFDNEGLRWDSVNQVPVLDSILEDPSWFNRKRLESQAYLVYWLCESLIVGACYASTDSRLALLGQRWGFTWNQMTEIQQKYVIEAIQVTMSYLLAVQWNKKTRKYDFNAPSSSSWEEFPYSGGCASDTGIMIDAARRLNDLLFSPGFAGNATIEEIRKRLHSVEVKHGKQPFAERLKQSKFADFRNPLMLTRYIAAGNKKQAKMVIEPVLRSYDDFHRGVPVGIHQFPQREADSSLALLAAYHTEFSTDPKEDAMVRLGIVRFVIQHLMDRRPNHRFGARRYSAHQVGGKVVIDSYLNGPFHFALLFPALFQDCFSTVIASQKVRGFHAEVLSTRDQLLKQVAPSFQAGEVELVKDTTDMESMVGRQRLSTLEWTAQWSIAPTACIIALAKAKISLLTYLNQSSSHDEDSVEMLGVIEKLLTEMINLSIALLVSKRDANGKLILRADGTELPDPINAMEAFQVVFDVEGRPQWGPGDHTLAWTRSQLSLGLGLSETGAHMARQVLR